MLPYTILPDWIPPSHYCMWMGMCLLVMIDWFISLFQYSLLPSSQSIQSVLSALHFLSCCSYLLILLLLALFSASRLTRMLLGNRAWSQRFPDLCLVHPQLGFGLLRNCICRGFWSSIEVYPLSVTSKAVLLVISVTVYVKTSFKMKDQILLLRC